MNKACTVFVLLWSINGVFPKENNQDNHDWDVLIFTQQWPETSCQEWIIHDPTHSCSLPKKLDTWSIHGIWPTKLGTIGPGFCNRTWLFDPEQIRPIETELIDKWTNIEKGTSLYSFWAHEWNKHGTCAAVLDSLNSEYKYFTEGLNLLSKYQMADILAGAGIVPDDTKEYKILDIYTAVKSKLGVNPSIQCRKEHGKSFLLELRICLDKNLNLCNCDGIKSAQMIGNTDVITNCHSSSGIIYPPTKQPQKSIYIQLYKLVTWLQWFTL